MILNLSETTRMHRAFCFHCRVAIYNINLNWKYFRRKTGHYYFILYYIAVEVKSLFFTPLDTSLHSKARRVSHCWWLLDQIPGQCRSSTCVDWTIVSMLGSLVIHLNTCTLKYRAIAFLSKYFMITTQSLSLRRRVQIIKAFSLSN